MRWQPLSKVHKDGLKQSELMQTVSVIIPAFNEEAVIDDCLKSLMAQTYPDFEVLIIDDASTDSTRTKILKFVSEYPSRIFLKEYGKVGPGRARNLASRDAKGDILAFTDADCIATPSWLSELILGFTNDQVGSTGGPHLAPPESSEFQKSVESFFQCSSSFIDFYKTDVSGIRDTKHNPLCNVAYRKEIYHQLNGFREDLFPGEDYEMDERVLQKGFRITYNPNAVVHHHRPESIHQFKKVMHAYGRAQGKLVRENGLRRTLHWGAVIFLTLLVLSTVGIVYCWKSLGVGIVILIWALIFMFRPRLPNKYGIFMNAFQWLNGFIEGFVTNKSPAPGGKN